MSGSLPMAVGERGKPRKAASVLAAISSWRPEVSSESRMAVCSTNTSLWCVSDDPDSPSRPMVKRSKALVSGAVA